MKTKLTCPKCGKSFEYEFIPGASFNAIRLGSYRYMRCQECGKWAMFNITKNLSPEQKHSIALFSIVLGIALAVLGGIIFVRASSIHATALYISGAFLFIIAIFMVGSGISASARIKKSNP